MSGAILGWGVDLGHEDSVAAKLFSDYGVPASNKDFDWAIYCYGPGHTYLALLLVRSALVKEADDTDHSVNVQVNLGSNGFPVLSSQPTAEEIEKLVEIINEVRPDKGTVELNMDLLLLPGD